MSPVRVGLSFCLLGLAWSAASSQPEPPVAPTPPKRTAAEEFLDLAVHNLEKLGGLDVRFRHQAESLGMPYEAEGRLVAGPDRKVLYELVTRAGDTEAASKLVCDGATVWRVFRLRERKPPHKLLQLSVNRYECKQLDEALSALKTLKVEGPEIDLRLVEQMLHGEHGWLGLRPSLVELQNRMTFPTMEAAELTGQGPVLLLKGHWTEQAAKVIAPPIKGNPNEPSLAELWKNRQDPFLFWPRSCRVYLSLNGFRPWTATPALWPVRVEWYGPKSRGGEDVLLNTIEFAQPVPVSEAELQSLLELSKEEKDLARAIDPTQFVRDQRNRMADLKREEQDRLKPTPR